MNMLKDKEEDDEKPESFANQDMIKRIEKIED